MKKFENKKKQQVITCSLFQAPREPREGEGEGAKRRETGERKRWERRGACNQFLKHLMPPTFFKMCQHVKIFHCHGFYYLREFSSSRGCPYVASMSRTPKGSPRLGFHPQKPVDFAKKF